MKERQRKELLLKYKVAKRLDLGFFLMCLIFMAISLAMIFYVLGLDKEISPYTPVIPAIMGASGIFIIIYGRLIVGIKKIKILESFIEDSSL